MRDWRLKMLDRDRMHLNSSMMLERSSRLTDATPAKSNYILQPHVLGSDRNMRMPKPRGLSRIQDILACGGDALWRLSVRTLMVLAGSR